jgi:hypothetical protein
MDMQGKLNGEEGLVVVVLLLLLLLLLILLLLLLLLLLGVPKLAEGIRRGLRSPCGRLLQPSCECVTKTNRADVSK